MNSNIQADIVEAVARISKRSLATIQADSEIIRYATANAFVSATEVEAVAHKAVHNIVAEKPFVGAGCECVICGGVVY